MVKSNDLLKRGYFPKELPPSFRTTKFAAALAGGRNSLPNIPTTISGMPGRVTDAKVSYHHLARPGKLRRNLAILHPNYYSILCEEIEGSWKKISRHCKKSKLSMTTPTIIRSTDIDDRAVDRQFGFDEKLYKRAEIRSLGKYIVTADITQFYQSLYTHVIPWALNGKEAAKLAVKNKQKIFGDDIDKFARQCQESQTLGIPIGPDTSLIIAEIVLSSIDNSLSRWPGFRYLDDYEFACNSYTDGRRILSDLQSHLRDFGLILNDSKTSIKEIPLKLNSEDWTIKLKSQKISISEQQQKRDLIDYFSTAYDIVRTSRDGTSSVLAGAIGNIDTRILKDSSKQLFVNLLFECITLEPGAIRPAFEKFKELQVSGFSPDPKLLEVAINNHLLDSINDGYSSEIAWSIFLANWFNIKISNNAAKKALKFGDCVITLLLLDAIKNRSLVKGSVDTTQLYTHLQQQSLYDSHWLLSYEANVKGWLTLPSGYDHVAADPFFAELKRKNVSFYEMPVLTRRTPMAASKRTSSSWGGYF
jgi:hypothetical protein